MAKNRIIPICATGTGDRWMDDFPHLCHDRQPAKARARVYARPVYNTGNGNSDSLYKLSKFGGDDVSRYRDFWPEIFHNGQTPVPINHDPLALTSPNPEESRPFIRNTAAGARSAAYHKLFAAYESGNLHGFF